MKLLQVLGRCFDVMIIARNDPGHRQFIADDIVRDLFQVFTLCCDRLDHRNPELFRKRISIDDLACRSCIVHHIEHDHQRFSDLGGLKKKIQIPLEMFGIQNRHDEIRISGDKILSDEFLLIGSSRERIDPRKIGK